MTDAQELTNPSPAPSRRTGLVIAALLAAVALLGTGGFLLRPGELPLPPCSEPFDALIYPWNFRWLTSAFTEGDLLSTHRFYHPTGESMALYTPTYVYGLLAWPFVAVDAVDGPVLATAFLIAASSVATALLGYALARQLCLGPFGAATTALLFTFCSGRLMNAARLNLFCTEFLLLFFCVLIWAWRRRSFRAGGIAGLCGTVLLLQSQPLFFQAAIAATVVFIGLAITKRGRSQIQSARGMALAMAIVFGLSSAPFLIALFNALSDSPALSQTNELILSPHANLDLTALVLPSAFDRFYGETLGARLPSMFEGQGTVGTTVSSFLGFGWWIGIVLAFVFAKAKQWRAILLVSLVVFGLALGPIVRAQGAPLPIPSLYQLVSWFPLVKLSKSPIRLVLLVQLGLALLAGLGIHATWMRYRSRGRAAHAVAIALTAVVALALAELSETLPLRSVRSLRIPTEIHAIAEENGNFAVLDLPFDGVPGPAHRVTASCMALGSAHRRPIFFGLFPRASRQNVRQHLESTTLFAHLHQIGDQNVTETPTVSDHVVQKIRAELHNLNVRYVIVHDLHDAPTSVRAQAQKTLTLMRSLKPMRERRLTMGDGYDLYLLRFTE